MSRSAIPPALFQHPRGARVETARPASFRMEACGGGARPQASAAVQRALPDKLTVDEVCDELGVAKSSFYDWRQKGRAPRCIRLPNGALRIRRTDFENWLSDCED